MLKTCNDREISLFPIGRLQKSNRGVGQINTFLDEMIFFIRSCGEEQEIQLAQEREEALNERDDAVAKAKRLSSLIAERDKRVVELQENVR